MPRKPKRFFRYPTPRAHRIWFPEVQAITPLIPAVLAAVNWRLRSSWVSGVSGLRLRGLGSLGFLCPVSPVFACRYIATCRCVRGLVDGLTSCGSAGLHRAHDSACLCFRMSDGVCVCLSVCLSIHLPICLPTYLYIYHCPSTYLPQYLSMYLAFPLSIHLSTYLPTYVS